MKKGFTLVELLAVIIILGIVALIATPIVLNIITDSKKSATKNSANNYINAVELAIAAEELDITKKIPDGGYYIMNDGSLCSKNETITCTGIKLNVKISGTIPESGQVAIKDGKIVRQLGVVSTSFIINGEKMALNIKGSIAKWDYKCKRATTLHKEYCYSYCENAGYTRDSSITYGNLGTSGTLNSGDAFDCDVNGDGEYNSTNERFYFVSNYYNTTTKTFDDTIATLIYYNNISGKNPSNSILVAYNAERKNYDGPVTLINYLPTTSDWPNINLVNDKRTILSEIATNVIYYGTKTLPSAYSYEGYSARPLTTQEINAACGITIGSNTAGELDVCQYLMENTQFSTYSYYNYWLETPYSNAPDSVYRLEYNRYIGRDNPGSTYYTGVRPAIEILKTDIKY